MWYVFFHEDSWQCGWSVASEKEAIAYCETHEGYDYVYVG